MIPVALIHKQGQCSDLTDLEIDRDWRVIKKQITLWKLYTIQFLKHNNNIYVTADGQKREVK